MYREPKELAWFTISSNNFIKQFHHTISSASNFSIKLLDSISISTIKFDLKLILLISNDKYYLLLLSHGLFSSS